METKDTWVSICNELQQAVSPDAVERWFKPLRLLEQTEDSLLLRADNTIYQYWIEENFMPQLKRAATSVLGVPVKIKFAPHEVTNNGDNPAPAASESAPRATPSARPKEEKLKFSSSDRQGGLNQRNSFESFVVGTNNEFAQAAARAVAKAPARTYNPLFLHGAVGLGKTHLMQAVGLEICKNKPKHKVLYVTSEQFTNEFISAIQHGELTKFRKHYRQVDVLLIDDVQFLAGKDRSQEEFFHTFNSLFDGAKQIVLTCDSPPNEIGNIEKRLISRFEWGLTAELQPPDMETRVAILRHKMGAMSKELSDDVIRFIANHVKSNVRRLEGALTRVAAFASLHGKAITVPQVEVLLKDLLQHENHQVVSIDTIQRKVAETYDIRLADMTSKRRPAHIALPRMVAMHLSRRLTDASLSEIGEAFGGRDHGTVLHAYRTIEKKMKADEKLRQVVGYLVEKLGGEQRT
ncbi:MAG: chromosomal replication initiator protein DnaA [Verrucomicrobiota bacterium]